MKQRERATLEIKVALNFCLLFAANTGLRWVHERRLNRIPTLARRNLSTIPILIPWVPRLCRPGFTTMTYYILGLWTWTKEVATRVRVAGVEEANLLLLQPAFSRGCMRSFPNTVRSFRR